MKKNKLYTANKWNRPAFMPEPNIFAGGGWTDLAQADKKANPWNYADDVDTTQQYMQSKNAFGISKADNPFSKGNLQGGLKSMASTPIGGALISGAAGAIGGLANSAISGGLESGAGSAISSIGSTVGGAVGSVNPVLGAAIGVGSQVLGGVTNALFGEKVDQAKLKAANESMSSLRSFNGNVGSFDDIKGPEATASVAGTYKGGLFNSSAKRKQRALEEAMIDARQYAGRAIANNVNNLADDQINNALANFSAFGGPLDMGGGALDYGLAMDYLTMKKQQNEAKNRVSGISPMPAINTFGHGGCFNPFALGDDTEVPQDNTKVFRPMMLPIQRQQNFSDSEYFWDAGKEYPAGLWKHKDGTFHTTGSYGKDIILTQEEADSIIRATKAKNRREKLRKAMENHKQNTYANGGQMYSVGQTYDVSEEEANRLKAMGYEFTVVS